MGARNPRVPHPGDGRDLHHRSVPLARLLPGAPPSRQPARRLRRFFRIAGGGQRLSAFRYQAWTRHHPGAFKVSATPLASVQLGIAVKKGAPKPDLSTADAVKRSLRAAKSVAYPDPASAAAGINFDLALKNMGLTTEIEPKLRRAAGAAGAMKMT